MHGLEAADRLLERIDEEMAKNPGKAVKEVRVNVGRLLFADIAQFTSAWELLVRDSPLGNATLKVEIVDGKDCTLGEIVYE